jgi:hypothetical protein
MDDDETAQHGQAAVMVVVVSRRSTDFCFMVTSVRPTEQVEGSRVVTNLLHLTKSNDEPTSFTSLRNEADLVAIGYRL